MNNNPKNCDERTKPVVRNALYILTVSCINVPSLVISFILPWAMYTGSRKLDDHLDLQLWNGILEWIDRVVTSNAAQYISVWLGISSSSTNTVLSRYLDWVFLATFAAVIFVCMIQFLRRRSAKDTKQSLYLSKVDFDKSFRAKWHPSLVGWRVYFKNVGHQTKTTLIESVNLIAYAVRVAFSLAILVVMLAPVLIPLILAISFNILELDPELPEYIPIITLLLSIGLISYLLQKNIETIRCSIKRIITNTVNVVKGTDIKTNLKETFTASISLISAVLFTCLILICGHLSVKELTKWQEMVIDKLNALEGKIGIRVILLNDFPPSDILEERSEYWLFYPSHGDLEDKDGICPTDGDLVNWLASFKSAISSCTDTSGLVRLNVRAFASTAPVTRGGEFNTSTSNELNCEIANQRAEAIIYFLTSKSDKVSNCRAALNERTRWGRAKNELCTRARLDSSVWNEDSIKVTYEPRHIYNRGITDSVNVWQGQGFEMTFQPWQCHEQMKKARLVKDGTLDNRREGLEFLNRTVQIIIEDGGCLTTERDIPDKSLGEQSNNQERIMELRIPVSQFAYLANMAIAIETSAFAKYPARNHGRF